ncbi:hypothetical protein DFH08DRAFT_812046 [Mycena albidolilacea]|uniref:Uncharacterized protein n=1 Tax=Mycena albidolilacea TaxID=1033008 RepID=A0AAD6ZV57_9AGAR|nr:hypothetical protein DFH08DRAFT_812046 [Mycena albidolilacea]
MAIQLDAGEVRDSQFSDPELNDTPAPPPIIFQNVFPPIPGPIQNPPPINPPVSSAQQAQHHWQTLLPGANGARIGPSKHAPRRCAVCVKAYCPRRLECPGKGGQKFCRCPGHTALAPGEKPNIPESRIIKYLAQQLQGH